MNPELTDALALLLGAIATALVMVVRFYFGSRSGDDCQAHESHHGDEEVSPKD